VATGGNIVHLSKQIQDGENTIDISGLQNGIYFVVVTTGSQRGSNTKLIIAGK